MNKIYKIVKRQPPEAVAEVATNSTSSPESPALESVEPETVPAPPEKLETLYLPPSTTVSLREWQREFREVEWQDDVDAWDSQLYD